MEGPPRRPECSSDEDCGEGLVCYWERCAPMPVSAAPAVGVEEPPPPPPAPRDKPIQVQAQEAFPKLSDFKSVVQKKGRAWNPAKDSPAGE
jgi:hypothetical protein